MIFRTPLRMALVFGAIHCLVDATCLALLLNSDPLTMIPDADYTATAILYNVLAFGLQMPVGWIVDRRRNYGFTAFVGMVSLALGLLISPISISVAVILAAVGNALFHVGAGALVLRCTPGRAYSAGVFVGPGALGVFLGIHADLNGWLFRIALMIGIVAIGLIFLSRSLKNVSAAVSDSYSPHLNKRMWIPWCVILLCASVSMRSLIGGSLNSLHTTGGPAIALALALAAVLGKVSGGFVADRFGWRPMTVIALGGLALLVPLMPQSIFATVAGALLLQTTMAVTLAAIYAMMPDRPGLAFGLPSLALLVGVGPSFLLSWSSIHPFVWPGVLLSLVTSWVALSIFRLNKVDEKAPVSIPGATSRVIE